MKIRTENDVKEIEKKIQEYLYSITDETRCICISIAYTVSIAVEQNDGLAIHTHGCILSKWDKTKDAWQIEISCLYSLIEECKKLLPETIFQKVKRLLTKTYTFLLK